MRLRDSLRALPRTQRNLLIVLAVFNAAILILLIAALLTDQPPAPIATLTDNSLHCEETAALHLRQSGVAASVTITNQAMLVRVDGSSDEAWDVFSMTTKLVPLGCGPYNLIRVDVPDPTQRADTRMTLELTGSELQFWAAGVLNDVQLAERMRRQLYAIEPAATLMP